MMAPKVYVMRVGDTSLGNLVRDCSADGTCVCVCVFSLSVSGYLSNCPLWCRHQIMSAPLCMSITNPLTCFEK